MVNKNLLSCLLSLHDVRQAYHRKTVHSRFRKSCTKKDTTIGFYTILFDSLWCCHWFDSVLVWTSKNRHLTLYYLCRYDVRQAYHRRSNETISSSVHSSQEELATRCKHTQQGISVWQCDCYETGNVWVKQRGERGSSKQKRKKEQGNQCLFTFV